MNNWELFLTPIWLSLRVSIIASVLVIILGILIASRLPRYRFWGKSLLETFLMMPLVLPPTVVGFLLLLLLGRQSWFGRFLEWILSQPVIFTWYAAVIAAVVVAFPIVYQTLKVGFAAVKDEYLEAARLDGASEGIILISITLPLSRQALITAYSLGFARALGEFGATLMIAGNIPGKTQTIPTAIYAAVESNHMSLAWAWTVVVLAIAFCVIFITARPHRERSYDGRGM